MISQKTALRWFGAARSDLAEAPGYPYPSTLGFAELREIAGVLDERVPFSTVTMGIEKGGVGKTSLVINLAAFFAARGLRVLVVDSDPQACATNFFLNEEAEYSRLVTLLEIFSLPELTFSSAAHASSVDGVWIIPSKAKTRTISQTYPGKIIFRKFRELLLDARKSFDIVFFDVPPSFSDLVAAAYMVADLVIIPVVPDIWSIESIALTMEDIHETARAWGAPAPEIRLVLNRYCPNRKAGIEGERIIRKEYESVLLAPGISESSSVQNALNDGVTMLNAGYGKVREEYASLARTVCSVLRGRYA